MLAIFLNYHYEFGDFLIESAHNELRHICACIIVFVLNRQLTAAHREVLYERLGIPTRVSTCENNKLLTRGTMRVRLPSLKYRTSLLGALGASYLVNKLKNAARQNPEFSNRCRRSFLT